MKMASPSRMDKRPRSSLRVTGVGLLLSLCQSNILAAADPDSWCDGTANEDANNFYDYIVVGAGAGGGVVASRLALAGYKTLLLDAGPDYQSDKTEVPLFWPIASAEPSVEWAFRSNNSPDPGRDNVLYPRAAMIGGCTMHHAMLSTYTFPGWWDRLGNLTGDEEFSEQKMRQRFKRVENSEYAKRSSPGHGFNGYIRTSLADLRLITGLKFLDFQAIGIIAGLVLCFLPENPILNLFMGLPFILDLNAPGATSKEGAHLTPSSVSVKNGYTRSSVYDLIAETRTSTTNLIVKPNSFVTKILLENKTAYGVEVQEGEGLYAASTVVKSLGAQVTYLARKEVILSGGTFNTPQMLMLSGIGPSSELQKYDIPVVVDLPGVGENLDDKLEATTNFQTTKPWRLYDQGCTFREPTLEEDLCYIDFVNRKFPNIYTSGGTLLAIQLKSDRSLEYPDLYLQITPNEFIGYQDGWVSKAFGKTNVYTINISTPRFGPSKGSVKLRSSDPFDVPSIDFNGYDDEDLTRVARYVIKIREYAASMTDLGFLEGPLVPDADVDTLEEYKAWIRATGWGHHPLGTAKMGADSDAMAVVNGQFQVRGVNNLRVVDASVFPDQPGFFPTIPIYMLAEKAADDIIKSDLTINPDHIGCV